MALAGDADPLAVVDPRRDVDLELALLERAAAAVAGRCTVLDPAAACRCSRGRLRADELAEDAPRDLLEPAGPPQACT